MGKRTSWGRPATALAAAAAAITLLAACGGGNSATAATSTSPSSSTTSSSSSAAPSGTGLTVDMHSGPLGTYLTDSSGRTLYLFAADTKNKSACTVSCLTIWPALVTSGAPQAGTGVKASLLGTTKDAKGETMVTYAGHPLYYYVSDSSAGQTAGQGLDVNGGYWYLLSPAGQAIKGIGTSTNGASSSTGGSSGTGGSWS